MHTKVVTIPSPQESAAIEEVGRALAEGKLVVIPTETVYGLGANGLKEEAVEGIFRAKGRPSDNPLILHVAEEAQVEELVAETPKAARDAMAVFWPGPLTMIFKKSDLVPDAVSAGLDTVAIRMPDHPVAHAILAAAAVPVAAPSANLSGKPSPTKASHVIEDLSGKVDIIVDGGSTNLGIESTVLDVTTNPPMILRPGGVTKEELETILGPVGLDKTVLDADSSEVPKSPGQKYRHYAPKGECTLFAGNLTNVAKEVNRRIAMAKGKRCAVMATEETLSMYEGMDLLLNMGSRTNLSEVAHNIFDQLRRCDEENMELIFVEGFEFEGLGAGIMNRLLKAAGGKVVLGL